MSTFAALMAIGESNNRASQAAVKNALEAKKKREAEQRRAIEEKEAREREREKQLRLKRIEEERREKEKKERLEAELKRKAEAAREKEQEKMHTMLFGKKAASRMGGSKSTSSSGSKPSGSAKKDNDDDDDSPGLMLTREELRARKQDMALKRQFQMSKRPTNTSGFSRRGNRLPGGAVNVTLNEEGAAAILNDNAGGSIKDRLSKMPNYLTKLNTVKRDRRTEDEIQTAIRERKAKVLEGDDAKTFDAWFSSPAKKKDAPKKSTTPDVVPASSSGSKAAASVSRSTNASTSFIVARPKIPDSIPASTLPPSIPSSRAPFPKSTHGSSSAYASYKSSTNPSRASSSEKQLSSSTSKLPKINKTSASSSSQRPTSSLATSKSKRRRSDSLSDSPPPKRRHASYDYDDDEDEDEGGMDIRNEIWGMFGKKRDQYISRNVYSDDEDMEADATALEREEMRSARIAKKEDLAALAEERKHEEEKRRRKKEKERATSRGY